MDGCTHHGGVSLLHADARTACDARNSVANGAACVPAFVSLPVVETKNPSAAVGGRGSGAVRGLGRGGAPGQLLRRKPSCLATEKQISQCQPLLCQPLRCLQVPKRQHTQSSLHCCQLCVVPTWLTVRPHWRRVRNRTQRRGFSVCNRAPARRHRRSCHGRRESWPRRADAP